MHWKLRIPLLLLTLGTISGIYQKIPAIFWDHLGYVMSSALFFIIIALLFMLFERLGINKRNVHFSIGLSLIFMGYFFDLLMK
ncbi:hypothetical protein M3N64_08380 [Sporolactobacillus sp. CPB3-1]|uniref:Uncharacterized protein n=1 Tax=Sporolactobacillus mangiferae TaxID=2940498 RepID=A0ABT0MAS4_9BACL|nr:hypothetical protein [Sporolactobacillus mangiferae]MCL1631964.1 hypothetical protein [Sporolactobacillus mangiferae]